jgi:hypothetical protein
MPRSSFVTIHLMAKLRVGAALPPIRRPLRLRVLVCSAAGVVAAATGCGGGEPLTIDAAPGELIAYTAGEGGARSAAKRR